MISKTIGYNGVLTIFRQTQMTACHLGHSGTHHHSNDRSSWRQQGGCHLPLTLWDCHGEVTRRFLEFENNIELILTLLPRSKELGRIQQPGGYNRHLSSIFIHLSSLVPLRWKPQISLPPPHGHGSSHSWLRNRRRWKWRTCNPRGLEDPQNHKTRRFLGTLHLP